MAFGLTYEQEQVWSEYRAFIAGIDNTVAGIDEYGDLSWHIDCSAQANSEGSQQKMLDTAKMILDCWEDFYPQLILSADTQTGDQK